MEFCACNGSILNTGVPNKQRVIASGVKLIAVRMKADDGVLNGILSTDVLDQAYVDARINNEDESKRWYPIGDFRSEDDVRADPLTESFSDGGSVITQQGVRTYTGWLINYAAAYLDTLESFKCSSFGLYTVDSCGAITGAVTKDGAALRPIRVNEQSWNPTYIKATSTVSAKVQLTFEFSQLEKDKYLRIVSEDEVTADLIGVEGLLPLTAAISSQAVTGFIAALTVNFDIFQNSAKTIVPAWVLVDFAVKNNTTNTAVVITSVTESPEGTYTFVIPSQASGDTLVLTNIKTSNLKPGFGLKQTVIIP